jgi:hypothetical protein
VYEDYWCGKALDMYEQALSSGGGFAALREAGSILANDLGQMRYRFDHTKYAVWPAYRDDNSILWTDAAAKQKVQETISHSRNSSAQEQDLPPEEEILIFYYDEWNATNIFIQNDMPNVKGLIIAGSSNFKYMLNFITFINLSLNINFYFIKFNYLVVALKTLFGPKVLKIV